MGWNDVVKEAENKLYYKFFIVDFLQQRTGHHREPRGEENQGGVRPNRG